MDEATIRADGEDLTTVPVITGTEGERAIDIAHLRRDTGMVTLDQGYGNTAETASSITFINGEEGILRYRGYPVSQLVSQSSFLEVSDLLEHGELPSQVRLDEYEEEIGRHGMLPDGLVRILQALPSGTHPMKQLAVSTALLGSYYPESGNPLDGEASRLGAIRLMSKMPVMAALSYRSSTDQAYVQPRGDLGYVTNFLNMMFSPRDGAHEVSPAHARALEALLILHADHGQNLSTSAVRLVGSSQADLFSAISAGILALSGPLHGGANERVVEMLESMLAGGGDTRRWIERAKDRDDPFRLMGFGHRVYRNFDPRAQLIKHHARELLEEQANPLLEVALQLEKEALADDFFIQRRIYPNVDYYSGIIYRSLGFPSKLFTVLFALGRLPGWLAQWREMMQGPGPRIKRPRQIYTGYAQRHYIPISDR